MKIKASPIYKDEIKEGALHGEEGHFCHGGCAGYAKGGLVPAGDLNPRSESSPPKAAMPHFDGMGHPYDSGGEVKGYAGGGSVERYPQPIAPQPNSVGGHSGGGKMTLPEILAGLAALGVAVPMLSHKFGPGGAKPGMDMESDVGNTLGESKDMPDVQMMAQGGEVGTMPDTEKNDASEIPDDIREFVDKAHKDRRESRPDEGWHIKPVEKPEAVAPYKKDDNDMERDAAEKKAGLPGYAAGGEVPGYDDGGQTPDPNQDLQDIIGAGGTMPGAPPITPPPAPAIQPADNAPIEKPDVPAPAPVVNTPAPAAPPTTDASYMDKANKLLGLNPDQQASFMKMLGQKSQGAQIGAGIAGIGDAIASGGTLGKVNPGGMQRAEDMIQNKEKAGIEGVQTIRGNQEKAQELADKLQSRDPNSPLSKYAQKAYGSIGKKLGLDLTHASAALIGDVTGKGVEALNTEYQGQLKQTGLDLQREQIKATIANQKAERREADTTRAADAAKTLANQGIVRKGLNQLTSSGRAAQKTLEDQANNVKSFDSVEEAEAAGLPIGTRISIGGRMATIK